MPGFDLSITGSATVLQPRPPPAGTAKPANASKPGRTLSNPAAPPVAETAKVLQQNEPKMADVISAKILERFTAFSEAFIPFDGNHTGAITRQHIEQGLLSKGFDMSKTSVDLICHRFSSASNPALVDYWALSTHLKMHSLSRGKQTGAIEEELRLKLDEHFRSFQHAFLCFDSERSGTVDLKNFTDVLKRFGICLSDSEVEELKREAAAAMAAEAQIMPARKKRDVIFGGRRTTRRRWC